MLERREVESARRVVDRHLVRTPMLSSRALGARLKCELFQRTGSFKARGALNKLASLGEEEKARGVIAISAGNHAQATAYAAAAYGVEALVVMWASASEQKIAATRAYGAAVDLEATTPAEAFERLEVLQRETGRTLAHPFDDPLVLAGAGTVGLEIEEEASDADAVVVPVGGGGLISGILAALRDGPMRVIAVEPEKSQALRAALEAGRPVPVSPESIADGLNAPFAGRIAVESCRGLEHVLVSEREIEDGFRFLYGRAKLAVEPAGAVAAAAVLAGKVEAARPVVVVSGGNVSPQTASDILTTR